MFSIEYLYDLMLLFFSFSVLGWFMEVFLKYLQYHRFINRGFLIGPYLPIYGTGVSIATLLAGLVTPYDDSVGTIFVLSFIACGSLEYFVSWYMEKRFHARWWDYSQKPMNLNGRVWIGNLILFGLAGTIIVKVIDPYFFALTAMIPDVMKPYICLCFALIMITDATVSHFIMKLLKTGIEHSEADDTETIGREIRAMMTDRSVLHRRFVNAYPEVVYRTDKVIKKLQTIRANTELIRQEVSERLASEKEVIRYNTEPASVIKNDIIECQKELIDMLDSGANASPREAELREQLASRYRQLEQREKLMQKLGIAHKPKRENA